MYTTNVPFKLAVQLLVGHYDDHVLMTFYPFLTEDKLAEFRAASKIVFQGWAEGSEHYEQARDQLEAFIRRELEG